jgi:hypothetical protein
MAAWIHDRDDLGDVGGYQLCDRTDGSEASAETSAVEMELVHEARQLEEASYRRNGVPDGQPTSNPAVQLEKSPQAR